MFSTVWTVFNRLVTTNLPFQATDKDAGKHGKIQYSLRGRDAQDFVINSETGTVYCARPANGSGADRTFEVVATDNDGKPGGFETSLPVTVSRGRTSEEVRPITGGGTLFSK